MLPGVCDCYCPIRSGSYLYILGLLYTASQRLPSHVIQETNKISPDQGIQLQSHPSVLSCYFPRLLKNIIVYVRSPQSQRSVSVLGLQTDSVYQLQLQILTAGGSNGAAVSKTIHTPAFNATFWEVKVPSTLNCFSCCASFPSSTWRLVVLLTWDLYRANMSSRPGLRLLSCSWLHQNPLLCCLPTHQVVSLHWNRRQHGPRCKVPLRKGEDFYHMWSTPHLTVPASHSL